MGSIQGLLKLIMVDVVGQPALMIALIAAAGLMLQRKSFPTVLAGGVKTAVGYLTIVGGAGIVVGVLNNVLSPLIVSAFNLTAPAAEAGGIGLTKFLQTWGGYATTAVALGFAINLLLARFTRFKYIYLTGHLMIAVAENIFVALLAIRHDLSPSFLIVTTGVVLGVYWTLQPAYMQKMMSRVTGTDDLAYGHTSSINCWLAAKLGRFVGSPDQSSEDIKLPESLEFFKDTTVSLGFVLALVTVVVAIVAGGAATGALSGGTNYIIFALMQGLTFGAGITVMLYGVRMVLGELIPAFRGIAKNVVPGAKPALDCPIVFPYAPTAVLLGFVGAFVAFLVCMFAFGGLGWGVVIPPMIMLFFPGGAGGVFGNSTGGWKGALLGGAICGVLLAFGQLWVGRLLANSVPYYAGFCDPDAHIIMAVANRVGALFIR